MAEEIGNGVILKISNEDTGTAYGSATFDTIGETDTMEIPGSEKPFIDLTSTEDTVRTGTLGIRNMPEISVTYTYDRSDTGQTEVETAHTNAEKRWLEFTLSDGTTKVYFQALILSLSPKSIGIDEKISAGFTSKPVSTFTVV